MRPIAEPFPFIAPARLSSFPGPARCAALATFHPSKRDAVGAQGQVLTRVSCRTEILYPITASGAVTLERHFRSRGKGHFIETLEDVAAHDVLFFNVVTGSAIVLTPQDQADIVACMKLLD